MIAIGILITIIILIIFIIWLIKRWKIPGSVFLRDQHNGTKYLLIPKEKLTYSTSGFEFSYFFWLYVNDWNYKFGKVKHILTRGELPGEGYNNNKFQSPGIYLDKTENDILFALNIKNEQNPVFIRLKDIPINKWIDLCIAVNFNQVDLYVNGKLRKTYVLKNPVQTNNDNMHICAANGFSGFLSVLSYYSFAVSPKEVSRKHLIGPYTRFWDNFKDRALALSIILKNPTDFIDRIVCNIKEEEKIEEKPEEKIHEFDHKIEMK
jgi:hypothetical protein